MFERKGTRPRSRDRDMAAQRSRVVWYAHGVRWAGATVGLGFVIGCSSPAAFTCADDAQCDGGRCEPSGSCSFPDSSCASGWAYGELSPPAQAGRCVDEDGGASSGSTPPSGSTSTVASAGTDASADTTAASTETAGTETVGNLGLCEAFAAVVESCYDGVTGSYGAGYFLEYCLVSYEMTQAAGPPCFEAFLEYLACVSALDCRVLQMGGACEAEAAAQAKLCSQDTA